MIYPTRSSAQMARQAFMQNWALEDIDFITMDELKERIFLGDRPLLEEEKRLLCLYSVLDESDREHFHINSYQDIIVWGKNWLDFFMELTEERIDPESLLQLDKISGFYLQSWQEEYIRHILELRKRYADYVHACGFEDKIFLYYNTAAQFPAAYQRFIFVNQYYYSALEKNLIQQMEGSGIFVQIISQGSKQSWEAGNFVSTPINLETLLSEKEYLTQKIDIHHSGSEDQMIISLLNHLQTKPPPDTKSAIIDRLFFQKPYQKLFDPELCKISTSPAFTSTAIYQMLALICEHSAALILEEERMYLPIRMLRDAFSQAWFISYFNPENAAISSLKAELDSLILDDYLYIDTDLMLFELLQDNHKSRYSHLSAFLKPYFNVLKNFVQIRNLPNLFALIDSEMGLDTRKLCTQKELTHSDVLRKFWERSANFFAIERLAIVSDWQRIFPEGDKKVAVGILELYLQFLKSARLHYDLPSDDKERYQISDLMDSRNQCYDRIVFNNVIEGEIPSVPSSVWLLNETQRKCLHLKTWEDIRNWERYYFFRLIFSAREVSIFCYQNMEQATQIGSLINELTIALEANPDCGITLNKHDSTPPIRELYDSILNIAKRDKHLAEMPELSFDDLSDEDICGFKREDISFFALPYASGEDFGTTNSIKTSYYALDTMLKNAFAWYISEHKRIRDIETDTVETLSRKVFGIILHEYISQVLHDYTEKYQRAMVADMDFVNDKYLREKLFEILENPLNSYKIPKNYNREFLFGIMADCLCAAIRWVFTRFLYKEQALMENTDPNGKQRRIKMIPESEQSTEEERKHKELIPESSNPDHLSLWIRGRADLRIETDESRYIIDFKTGKGSPEQLIIYEWFYYLLEAEEGDEVQITSIICNMLERTLHPNPSNIESRDKLYFQINDQLNSIITNGYRIATKVADRKLLQGITRADLFKSNMWSPNE